GSKAGDLWVNPTRLRARKRNSRSREQLWGPLRGANDLSDGSPCPKILRPEIYVLGIPATSTLSDLFVVGVLSKLCCRLAEPFYCLSWVEESSDGRFPTEKAVRGKTFWAGLGDSIGREVVAAAH